VQFHPNGSLLLTAGLDKSVRLFNIDGRARRITLATSHVGTCLTTRGFNMRGVVAGIYVCHVTGWLLTLNTRVYHEMYDAVGIYACQVTGWHLNKDPRV